MTGKPKNHWVFHRNELISLGMNQMNIDNHRMTCGKRGKNPSQPINSMLTSTNTNWNKWLSMAKTLLKVALGRNCLLVTRTNKHEWAISGGRSAWA